MSEIEFELDPVGIEELLTGEEMKKVLQSYADDIKSRAGDGYETDTKLMGGKHPRVIGSVYTGNRKAYFDNMRNNTLLKAVQSHD